jgi:hypothetical protein
MPAGASTSTARPLRMKEYRGIALLLTWGRCSEVDREAPRPGAGGPRVGVGDGARGLRDAELAGAAGRSRGPDKTVVAHSHRDLARVCDMRTVGTQPAKCPPPNSRLSADTDLERRELDRAVLVRPLLGGTLVDRRHVGGPRLGRRLVDGT